MEKEAFPINYDQLLEASDTIELSIILNTLPFGLSVQNRKRVILYENDKCKELTGSFKNHHCYGRWKYITGEGEAICQDCPAIVTLIDGVKHKVFRKTVNRAQEDLYLEIQSIPVLEKDGSIQKYIEIINDVSNDEKIKSLVNKPFSEFIEDLQFSISIYGKTGGEVLLKDTLDFFPDPILYIQKLSMFTYIGVFQNYHGQIGLFGPLPVLDIMNKSMMVYSFRLASSTVTDPRKNGMENCLFITYLDRDDYFIFEERDKILSFFNNTFENKNVEDLDEEWFKNLKLEFKKFLTTLFNEFELKE